MQHGQRHRGTTSDAAKSIKPRRPCRRRYRRALSGCGPTPTHEYTQDLTPASGTFAGGDAGQGSAHPSLVTPVTPLPAFLAFYWRMRHTTLTALGVAAALALAGPARAQETGTPVFSAPYRAFSHHELGLSLSAPKGSDLGLEGFYSFASGRNDFGLRVGVLDEGNGSDLVLGGRFRARLITHSEDFPLDGALTVGLGALFLDGGTVLRTPIGLSLGRRIDSHSSGVSFVPYLQPVLIPTFSDGDSEAGLRPRVRPRPSPDSPLRPEAERLRRRPRGLRGRLRLGPVGRPAAAVTGPCARSRRRLGRSEASAWAAALTRERGDDPRRPSGGRPVAAGVSPARRSGPLRPRSASAGSRTRRRGCRSRPS